MIAYMLIQVSSVVRFTKNYSHPQNDINIFPQINQIDYNMHVIRITFESLMPISSSPV